MNLAGPGVPVQQNVISEGTLGDPRVWLQRRPSTPDLFLDGSVALSESVWAVEVSGTDVDATEALADTIVGALNGLHGQMGGSYVLGAFTEEIEGDYTPSSLSTDVGYHVSAFTARLIV